MPKRSRQDLRRRLFARLPIDVDYVEPVGVPSAPAPTMPPPPPPSEPTPQNVSLNDLERSFYNAPANLSVMDLRVLHEKPRGGDAEVSYMLTPIAPAAPQEVTISLDRTLKWDIQENVYKSYTLQWTVDSPLVAVPVDRSLLWEVLQQVTKDSSLKWDTQQTVSKDSSLLWDMLQTVSKDGIFVWTVDLAAAPATLPDKWANRRVITGTSGTTTVTGIAGTDITHYSADTDANFTNMGFYNNASGKYNDVWFEWTCPTSGIRTWDTLGSSGDTVLEFYTKSGTTWTYLAGDDDTAGASKSKVNTYNFTAGVVYHIRVGLYSAQASGTLTHKLNWV